MTFSFFIASTLRCRSADRTMVADGSLAGSAVNTLVDFGGFQHNIGFDFQYRVRTGSESV